MVDGAGGPFTFSNLLVAYREAGAHTVLFAGYGMDGSITGASLLVNDTLQLVSIVASGSSALTSSHAGCPSPPAFSNPNIVSYTLAKCASARFLSSASADFSTGPSVDNALRHLSFGATVFSGETFKSGFTDSVTH